MAIGPAENVTGFFSGVLSRGEKGYLRQRMARYPFYEFLTGIPAGAKNRYFDFFHSLQPGKACR